MARLPFRHMGWRKNPPRGVVLLEACGVRIAERLLAGCEGLAGSWRGWWMVVSRSFIVARMRRPTRGERASCRSPLTDHHPPCALLVSAYSRKPLRSLMTDDRSRITDHRSPSHRRPEVRRAANPVKGRISISSCVFWGPADKEAVRDILLLLACTVCVRVRKRPILSDSFTVLVHLLIHSNLSTSSPNGCCHAFLDALHNIRSGNMLQP